MDVERTTISSPLAHSSSSKMLDLEVTQPERVQRIAFLLNLYPFDLKSSHYQHHDLILNKFLIFKNQMNHCISSVRNVWNIQSKEIIVISKDIRQRTFFHVADADINMTYRATSESSRPKHLTELETKNKNRKLKSRLILNVLPFEDNLLGLCE